MNRPLCEDHDKVLYKSKHDAVSSLARGLKSKRVRVYPCPAHPGQFHLTKEAIKYR